MQPRTEPALLVFTRVKNIDKIIPGKRKMLMRGTRTRMRTMARTRTRKNVRRTRMKRTRMILGRMIRWIAALAVITGPANMVYHRKPHRWIFRSWQSE